MGLLRSLIRQFRTPTCPAPSDEKTWVEQRLSWLITEFGTEAYRGPTLVPTPEFFPQAFRGSTHDLQSLFSRLCTFTGLDPSAIDVSLYREERTPEFAGVPIGESQHHGSAGLYAGMQADSYRVGIEISLLERPPELVATICHELAHVHLLGHGRLTGDDTDHERLTDLLTIFLRTGVFTANSAYQFSQWQTNTHQGWTSQRLGYLPEPTIAYSLACYAWLRGEVQPSWLNYLEPGIRTLAEDSLDFLIYTEDCTLPRGQA